MTTPKNKIVFEEDITTRPSSAMSAIIAMQQGNNPYENLGSRQKKLSVSHIKKSSVKGNYQE
jgi:hypothetical protein